MAEINSTHEGGSAAILRAPLRFDQVRKNLTNPQKAHGGGTPGRTYCTARLLLRLFVCSVVGGLREDLFAKPRTFHSSCCRAMCRITMAHTIRHHIPSKQLHKRFGIAPVDRYYHRRLLRWSGHVSRMPMTRAPLQLLTGWVAHPRPTGSPQMTSGRTLKKVLV